MYPINYKTVCTQLCGDSAGKELKKNKHTNTAEDSVKVMFFWDWMEESFIFVRILWKES